MFSTNQSPKRSTYAVFYNFDETSLLAFVVINRSLEEAANYLKEIRRGYSDIGFPMWVDATSLEEAISSAEETREFIKSLVEATEENIHQHFSDDTEEDTGEFIESLIEDTGERIRQDLS